MEHQLPLQYKQNVDAAMEAVQSLFPFSYGDRELRLIGLSIGNAPDPSDKEAQKTARIAGTKWAVPLNGSFELRAGGKVLDTGSIRLVNVPVPTDEGSYILSRSEHYPFIQPRLKPGIYLRRRTTGDAEAQFNLSKGSNFTMHYDPGKSLFTVRYKATRAPLYHVLRAIGVADSELRSAWGEDVWAKNKAAPNKLKYLVKSSGIAPTTDAAAAMDVSDIFNSMEISTPEVPEQTIGLRTSKVSGAALVKTSTKLRKVQAGDEEPDNRESPEFKWFMDMPEYIRERIQRSGIDFKLRRRIHKRDTVRDAFGSSSPLDAATWAIFSSAGLSDRAAQTNPVAVIMATHRVSILGEGGIGSLDAVTDTAKEIHPGYLGVFDPVVTPEGQKTGIVYPLSSGVTVSHKNAILPVIDVKTRAMKHMTIRELFHKNLTNSDEVVLAKEQKRLARVICAGHVQEVLPSEVDFVLRPASTLSIPARLVPFFSSTSPNRAEMAARFMTQARVVKDNEEPLVQVVIPKSEESIERFIGTALLARKSPVEGTVTKIETGFIEIADALGKPHKVYKAHLFPLNDGYSFDHDRVVVKVGDKVARDQVVAESKATKNGALALGVNARVAYMSDGGFNFDDGVTMSASLAKRLAVETLSQKYYDGEGNQIGSEKYAQTIAPLTQEERGRLENGVVKVGATLKKGDLLVAAVRSTPLTKEEKLLIRSRSDASKLQDASIYWDRDFEGKVVEVRRDGDQVYVGVISDEPVRVGDKFANRLANKGVVARILPDEHMPKTKDGRHMELLLNMHGVGNRMNSSQCYEALVGKVAEKRGEPIAVPQFPTEELGDETRQVKVKTHTRTYYVGPDKKPVTKTVQSYSYDRNFVTLVEKLLASENLEAEEELFWNGRALGKVFTGKTYAFRLMQLAEDKQSIRGFGHPYFYNSDRAPVKGSSDVGDAEIASPQAAGRAYIEALLTHGAIANIRDIATYKSDRDNDSVWTAIQEGAVLPPPQIPFINQKFETYLTGLGLRVERDGDEVSLLPMTDKEVRKLSNGEIDKSTFFAAKDGKAKPGELFDSHITGGVSGEGWGHIELAEPVPNPMMMKAIAAVLGVPQKTVVDIAVGRKHLYHKMAGFGVSEDPDGALSLEAALKSVNVDEELKREKDPKRIRYLRALEKLGVGADIYLLHAIPVIPPIFRPVSPTSRGEPLYADLNLLYSDVISANSTIKSLHEKAPDVVGELEDVSIKGKLFENVALLYGMGGTSQHNRDAKGIVEQLHGTGSSKFGMVQRNLLRRRQDLTGRAVIIPGPELKLDQIGIPYDMLLEMYKPFVIRELGMTPLRSQELIKNTPNDPSVRSAVERVIAQRPIWAARDPILHKFGLLAFYPVIMNAGIDGKMNAVAIHPMVTGGFNADHDGDTMSFSVPVSDEAVDEAKRAVPSRNIKDPSSGSFMMSPTLEAATGLRLMTMVDNIPAQRFGSMGDAVAAYQSGALKASAPIEIGGVKTTAGRELLRQVLPDELKSTADITNPPMDKKLLGGLLTKIGKTQPGQYGHIVDNLRRLGLTHIKYSGFSLKLSDFHTVNAAERDAAFKEFDAKSPGMSTKDRNQLAATLSERVSSAMKVPEDNALVMMSKGSGKPGSSQIQQMLVSPMFAPWDKKMLAIRSNFSQGMSSMDYWAVTPSARTALIDKVSAVSLPGDLTKQMAATAIDQVVVEKDCGSEGAVSSLEDSMDHLLAEDTGGFKAGSVVGPDIMQELRQRGLKKIRIRSPLLCREAHGICAKCYGETEHGPAQVGDNVGLRAAQSMGERAVQLTLRNFHSGGFNSEAPADALAALLRLPENMPNKATIATMDGKVGGIKKTADGFVVSVGNKDGLVDHFIPKVRAVKVNVGDTVRAAQALSDGTIDPRDVLDITHELPQAQKALVDGIHGIYEKYGVQRKHAEVLVRALTNLARVDDPGTSSNITGDYIPYYAAQAWNRDNDGTLVVTPIIKGVATLPQTRDDWLAGLGYRNIRQQLADAASTGEAASTRSLNPRPVLLMRPHEFGVLRKKGDPKY